MPLPVQTEQKRRRGAQPGNLNALKHGFYLNHSNLRGAAPLRAADLDSVSDAITAIREHIRRTSEMKMDHVTLEEVSEATRSLALAGLALVRLFHIQQAFANSSNIFYSRDNPQP